MTMILRFLPALFALLQLSVRASDTTIVFRELPHSKALELARVENKPILLYFHFDGCGACVTMEKTTFKDQTVADFYNSHFVCLSVNTRKGAGIETNQIYHVQMHPTFLFLDSTGSILHKIVGVFDAEQFLAQAKIALTPETRLATCKNQYLNGNRNPDFLFDYCYKLRDAYELDSLAIHEYLNTQTPQDLFSKKNIRFIYEFAMHRGNICIPMHSPAFQFMYTHRDLFQVEYEMEQVNTRLMLIVQGAVYRSIEQRDTSAFWSLLQYLKEFDTGKEYNFKETDGRITLWTTSKALVTNAMLAFYERMGDTSNYRKTLDQYIASIWNDQEELNNFAWDHFTSSDDKSILAKALQCAERSVSLNGHYNNTDTYASLLYKLEKYEEARVQAEKAIRLAQQQNLDHKETSALLERIMEKINGK